MTFTKCTERGADGSHHAERRRLLKFALVGVAAGTSVAGLTWATAAEASGGKAKVVFVLFKRSDLTHDQCLADWSGERHTAIVRTIPGLRRWVQNHVSPVPGQAVPDGIGELWFDDAPSMDQAMNSAEMAAAVEDAKNFLDMEKTYALVVAERTIIA